jgi:anti-sigma B factor antagonist
MDGSNAEQIQDELLSVINGGATGLIADMTATIWCDHAGAGAVVRAFQRAVITGTELRPVVTAPAVSRVLSRSGVDRLVPIHPSLEAATAASRQRRCALTAEQRHRGQELLDTIITSLLHVGLSLHAPPASPHRRPGDASMKPSAASTAPSARSATTHSPPAATARHRSPHPQQCRGHTFGGRGKRPGLRRGPGRWSRSRHRRRRRLCDQALLLARACRADPGRAPPQEGNRGIADGNA